MTKRLGRGLDSLITRSETLPTSGKSAPEIRLVDPTSITVNRAQPRTHFDESAIEELSASIQRDGILQPLVVRAHETGGYELIAGERRLRASMKAGLTEVPAVIRDTDPEIMLELALIENIQREDLNPIELAQAYRQLKERHSWTQAELAERLGKKRSSIANALRFLDLPEPIQQSLAEGKLSAGHAKLLLGVEDPETQLFLHELVVENEMTVRELEDEIRGPAETPTSTAEPGSGAAPELAGPGSTDRPRSISDPVVDEQKQLLSERLGTKVDIRIKGHGARQRGKIVIDFYSTEDFERLRRLLLGDE